MSRAASALDMLATLALTSRQLFIQFTLLVVLVLVEFRAYVAWAFVPGIRFCTGCQC